MRGLVASAVAALVLAGAAGPQAQQAGASRTALATVLDPRGRPILDIDVDDFVIQEAGQSREVLSVRVADYPVVVMLDTGRAAEHDLPLIRKAVARFVERVGRQRPIAVGVFGEAPKLLTGFDDERPALLDRLEALSATAGGSLLFEGANAAARMVAGSLFSAVVVLSAGAIDDERSRIDQLIGPIVNSGAMLHVVMNGASPPNARPDPHATLRALAEQTRGHYTRVYSAASYQAALDRLADRLAGELMIDYIVPIGSRPNDVKVGVRIPGMRVQGLGVAPR